MDQTNWLTKSTKKVMQIRDTPEAVSIGVAVGVFFGFSPFFGLKTALAVGVAWLLRGSKLAAAIVVALHGVLLPFLPMLLRLEYDLGYWTLSFPHVLPPRLDIYHFDTVSWLHWSTLFTAGRPILIGSMLMGAPLALVAYIMVRWTLKERIKSRAVHIPSAR